jgi:starch synthase (maltosyl-transferring)
MTGARRRPPRRRARLAPAVRAVPTAEGRARAVIERLAPVLDGGRFPVRRVPGEAIAVEADLFTDGTDVVRGEAVLRTASGAALQRVPMTALGEDRFRGTLVAPVAGEYRFGVEAWVDPYLSWRADLARRVAGGRVDAVDLEEGRRLLTAASERVPPESGTLAEAIRALEADAGADTLAVARRALAGPLPPTGLLPPDPERVTASDPLAPLRVEPEEAAASAWYELFPRSASPDPARAGTLRDLRRWVPYVADLGFDVLYLPPIHPIGWAHRKGPQNAEVAAPGDPGSPWAIGNATGGHDAVHPDLGTLAQFEELVRYARAHHLEVALDLAFQCSPDHPWVAEHPDWFRHRADGSIRSAENPPKRYEDVYPLDFESPDWRALWGACLGVVEHWVGLGVRRFRVDNPHTKPFAFWEWLLAEVRAKHPEVQFLAEAFTRPAVMYRLAKLGFTHSYTYFAWRDTKAEITQYFEELQRAPVRDFFRPHLWPNTPDILTEYLQTGGAPAFAVRLVLAATLAPNYGIFGPSFERAIGEPRMPGEEEYAHSEKYEVRHWDLAEEAPLAPLLRRMNAIRRAHPALRRAGRLTFVGVSDPELLAYVRTTDEGTSPLLVVVNLDPFHVRTGFTELDLRTLGLAPERPYAAHDLLSDRTWSWLGPRNYVELRPFEAPAQLFDLTQGPGRPAGG